MRNQKRIPYGVETRDGRCHDCGVQKGDLHAEGCDWEECPTCHGQKISCGCPETAEVHTFIAEHHVREMMTRAVRELLPDLHGHLGRGRVQGRLSWDAFFGALASSAVQLIGATHDETGKLVHLHQDRLKNRVEFHLAEARRLLGNPQSESGIPLMPLASGDAGVSGTRSIGWELTQQQKPPRRM